MNWIWNFHSLKLIKKMKIYIQSFVGKPIIIEAAQPETINDIKWKINKLNGFDVDKQKLYYNGKKLEN